MISLVDKIIITGIGSVSWKPATVEAIPRQPQKCNQRFRPVAKNLIGASILDCAYARKSVNSSCTKSSTSGSPSMLTAVIQTRRTTKQFSKCPYQKTSHVCASLGLISYYSIKIWKFLCTSYMTFHPSVAPYQTIRNKPPQKLSCALFRLSIGTLQIQAYACKSQSEHCSCLKFLALFSVVN